ncbi:MAG: hypothetical protein H6652_17470 [Ardenticatenaceae bacterium]|nr:hypothetical protein [Ardenticatenaceae bacterium]
MRLVAAVEFINKDKVAICFAARFVGRAIQKSGQFVLRLFFSVFLMCSAIGSLLFLHNCSAIFSPELNKLHYFTHIICAET